MTTWNFGEGRHEYSAVLDKIHRTFLFNRYGQKMWKMVMEATAWDSSTLFCHGYIECLYKFKKSTLWSCYAEIEIQATNKYGTSTGRKRRILLDFKKNEFLRFHLTAGDCFPDGNESALKEAFHFVINFRILSLVGVQNRPISDFSSSKNIDSEVAVLVGEQRLYVDKYPLMSFSPVLCEIINNGMNSNNEIEIKDAKVEDVVAFLRLLYRQKPPMKFENVEGLMSLIIRYDAQCVIPVVEEDLISTVKTTLEQKFHIAELYSFSDLQKVALEQQVIEQQRKMAAALEDGIQMMGGGMQMTSKKKAAIEASIEAGLREHFEKKTMLHDEHEELRKYIDDGLKKTNGEHSKTTTSGGGDGNFSVLTAEERDAALLRQAAGRLKANQGKKETELLSEHMLAGIPEVDLGISARITNILETEKKKKFLMDKAKAIAAGLPLPEEEVDEPPKKRWGNNRRN